MDRNKNRAGALLVSRFVNSARNGAGGMGDVGVVGDLVLEVLLLFSLLLLTTALLGEATAGLGGGTTGAFVGGVLVCFVEAVPDGGEVGKRTAGGAVTDAFLLTGLRGEETLDDVACGRAPKGVCGAGGGCRAGGGESGGFDDGGEEVGGGEMERCASEEDVEGGGGLKASGPVANSLS